MKTRKTTLEKYEHYFRHLYGLGSFHREAEARRFNVSFTLTSYLKELGYIEDKDTGTSQWIGPPPNAQTIQKCLKLQEKANIKGRIKRDSKKKQAITTPQQDLQLSTSPNSFLLTPRTTTTPQTMPPQMTTKGMERHLVELGYKVYKPLKKEVLLPFGFSIQRIKFVKL